MYRLIIPDLPGFGATAPLKTGQHSIDGYAELVRKFIDQLPDKSINLLGHSFGALIAIKLTAENPGGIERLVLLNPVGESNKQLAMLGRWYYWIGLALPEKLGQQFFYSRLINQIQSRLMMKTTDSALRRVIYEHHLRDLDSPYSRTVFEDAVNSILNGNALDYASQIKLPTLLIGGSLDELAPVAVQKNLASHIQKSELHILPDVGHLVHLEQPGQAASLINQFLS